MIKCDGTFVYEFSSALYIYLFGVFCVCVCVNGRVEQNKKKVEKRETDASDTHREQEQ